MISPELRRFPLTAAIACAVLLFLYLPMLTVMAMSFNVGPSALIWDGFGIRG